MRGSSMACPFVGATITFASFLMRRCFADTSYHSWRNCTGSFRSQSGEPVS